MLVDDNAGFVNAATTFLNSLPGVAVVGRAATAAAGLAQVDEVAPDLVIVDVVMPGMSGLQAVSLLKGKAGAPKTVVVTLYDTEAYRSGAARAGADGFVAKSNFVTELPRLLESLFPGSRG